MSTPLPKISVVIPSYNQGRFLDATIQSVLGQGYPDLEVIVMDGGSTDESVDVIRKWEKSLAHWQSQKDNGQAGAINAGMRRATGDVLCWLNSDDMFMPGALADIGARFAGTTEKPRLIYGGTVALREEPARISADTMSPPPFDAARLRSYDYLVQPATFWTRALWDAAGPLDESLWYMLDWDWYIRATAFCPFERVLKFYALYRFHPAHKTGSGGTRRWDEIQNLIARYGDAYAAATYKLVGEQYNRLAKTRGRLARFKIPKAHWWIRLRHPILASKVRSVFDLFGPMDMLGAPPEQAKPV